MSGERDPWATLQLSAPDARPAATDGVRAEWAQRTVAEYHSAAITQHLTLWLIQIGASPDLIRMGLRITDDELVHAEMAHGVLNAAGGELASPLDRDGLCLARDRQVALEVDVARTLAEVFCLGETVAVPLFAALRRGCTVPIARDALDRVLDDEVRHRDFGWQALTWLLTETTSGDDLRAHVQRELGGMFRRLSANYAGQRGQCSPAEIAWGLMAPPKYGVILVETLARAFVPRFEALGIDAASAWAEAMAPPA